MPNLKLDEIGFWLFTDIRSVLQLEAGNRVFLDSLLIMQPLHDLTAVRVNADAEFSRPIVVANHWAWNAAYILRGGGKGESQQNCGRNDAQENRQTSDQPACHIVINRLGRLAIVERYLGKSSFLRQEHLAIELIDKMCPLKAVHHRTLYL